MTEHRITDQDVAVLLGVRNTLDRFVEVLEGLEAITGTLYLRLGRHRGETPLLFHTRSIREDLRGILRRVAQEEKDRNPNILQEAPRV